MLDTILERNWGSLAPKQGSEIPVDVKRFADTIAIFAHRAFLNGTFGWRGSARYDSTKPKSLYFWLTTENKWHNDIRENDPSYSTWWIYDAYTDAGMLPQITVEIAQGGKVYGFNARNPIKVGWRNFTGTPDQVSKHMAKYFQKLQMVYESHPDLHP